jgi:hypothetical protein
MTLAELATREEELFQRVLSATGLMEEKHEQLRTSGVYDAYRAIHCSYARLLDDPGSSVEALKRALFLGWYDLSEPACFTGVFELSGEVNREVLCVAEALLREGGLDLELEWTLPFYYSITDYYFTIHGDLPLLQAFFTEADSSLYQRVDTTPSQFRGRGQMGEYWLSVLRLA